MGRSTLTAVELRKALDLMGFGREDFADQLNVRGATVSRWLAGKVPVPGYVEAWMKVAWPDVFWDIKNGE